MRRGGRRSNPIVPKILRVELDESHLPLRLFAVGILIAIAALAFGYLINQVLTPNIGWQKIDPTNSQTAANTQFVLTYDIGHSGNATAEYRQVSTCFTDVSDEMYRVLSDVPMAPYVNLYNLNTAPNTIIQVDEALYGVLQTLEAAGTREHYYAPIREIYDSLFGCQNDGDAMLFDPAYSEEMADFIEAAAAFAGDPNAVQIQLLPDNCVTLQVSVDYLAFAREYELERYVSLGWMQNAFILDAVADALIQRGLTHGVIASLDGCTRTLGEGEYNVQIFGQMQGKTVPFGNAVYKGAKSSIYYRGYPLSAEDTERYYVYADGTVRAPYMNRAGQLNHSHPDWLVLSETRSCARLMLETLPVYTGDRDMRTDGLSWLRTSGNEILVFGDALSAAPTRPGVQVRTIE